MHLGDSPLRADLEVLAVDLTPAARLRLAEVGVHVGALIQVTHRGPFGGRVLAVHGSRLAVDAGTASCIAVEIP